MGIVAWYWIREASEKGDNVEDDIVDDCKNYDIIDETIDGDNIEDSINYDIVDDFDGDYDNLVVPDAEPLEDGGELGLELRVHILHHNLTPYFPNISESIALLFPGICGCFYGELTHMNTHGIIDHWREFHKRTEMVGYNISNKKFGRKIHSGESRLNMLFVIWLNLNGNRWSEESDSGYLLRI